MDRLKQLGLYSIQGRLLRADLIKMKILGYNEGDRELASLFQVAGTLRTRGHSLKLVVPVCHSDVRHRFFAVRRVMIWNSLPNWVVTSESLACFKRRLDVWLGDRLFEVV